MDEKLLYLIRMGFVSVGAWTNLGKIISHDIHLQFGIRRNVLYAFSVDEDLAYVGLTTMSLKERMRRYAHPPKKSGNGGGTNIKNHRNILDALNSARRVAIFSFMGLHHTENECAPKGSPLYTVEHKLRLELRPPWNDV